MSSATESKKAASRKGEWKEKSNASNVLPADSSPAPLATKSEALPETVAAVPEVVEEKKAVFVEEPKAREEVAPAASPAKSSTALTPVEQPKETIVASGVLMVQSRFDGVYTYVKDGFLFIYGKVGESYICIKIRERAVNGYVAVTTNILDVYQLAKTKGTVFYDLTQQKALENFRRLNSAVQKIPVPVPVKNGTMYLFNKGSTVAVFLKGKSMYLQGQVGNAVLAIKVRGVDTFDAGKAKALDTYNAVARTAEPYLLRAQDRVTSIKGKIQGTVVSIKTRGQSKALDAYKEIKAVIDRLPLTSKVKNGMTVVKGKVGDITIYVKDGYMYAASQIGDATYFVKAKVSKVQDAAQVKVLEAYSRTKVLSGDLAKYMLSLTDAAREKADKKPVSAGAACGAMVGGAGGASVGGIAGTIAGGMAGVPFALFTLGLSIPAGAILGGGVGVSAGAVTGGAAGVVTGATAGYGYGRRDEIKSSVQNTIAKANSAGTQIQGKVMNQVEMVKERFVSGTGSTA